MVQAALLFYAASWIDPLTANMDVQLLNLTSQGTRSLVRFVLWALYGFFQGLVFTGVWVVAHECGHQAFSPSKSVNNTVGWIFHSFVLVPYHSWRISHARHHAGTGHMKRDEVFVPKTRAERGLAPLRPTDSTCLLYTSPSPRDRG